LNAAAVGSIIFTVTNSGSGTLNWYPTVTSGTWLTIPTNSGGTNNGSFTATYSANLGAERSATITVTAPGASQSPVTITVTQLATNSARAAGVDVSRGNGTITWGQVTGVQFAYIKATESNYSPDAKFADNSKGASDQKIVRGAYHFATPLFSANFWQSNYDHQDSAADEAANFWNASKNWIGQGFLPPALDVEEQVVAWNKNADGTYTANIWVDPLTGACRDNNKGSSPIIVGEVRAFRSERV
jgi:hypothetical protein